ncbi:hypothetical protein ACFODL_07320 [Phenylobacterium terrae]|uniref:Chemotaxis protein CheE n=1 Tax=Phenylobacterium terrae TaxID=2665495 RepID=A0ABW4N775_9CAUL
MSAVRFFVPENRLGKLLRIPGGAPVADAVVAAEAGLAELEAPAREELAAALAAVEACAAQRPAQFEAAGLEELYGLAQGAIGLASLCQRPSVDEALRSLCDLLDHLARCERWDAEAVSVHVRSLRLLMGEAGAKDGEAAAAVLQGLRRVSGRYAGTPGG